MKQETVLMINLYEYIKMAVHNITANKGRSFLTMLGIIIGIASVIAIVSIGEGTKNQMNSEIDGIGSGLIAIDVSSEAMTEDEWKSTSLLRMWKQSGSWMELKG